ncbi:hypothetical protein [Noviluteimonas gilva]|uniref:Uncharacterized protein n=1 Tax=Noviluteimonas gilva TaxID=2682097 RepID=A0A7C9HUD5_9GAMM|nr:hypothetical protein [Lysobacter gilvus]MUV13578.1 hypothetical protein [Lysobacter gilvus]
MSGPDYADWSHADLLRLRNSLAANDPMQAVLAPYEHAAFAREWTQENPMVAVPALSVAIPGYSLAKKFGLVKARTPGTLSEMAQSFGGMRNGLAAFMQAKR